ncbi:MobC family plasmid mobilization relaxosome protein [Nocardia sp. NPDC052001]|uniref:MobC family plasmid mobilization relaxosome protein n=1 Tax=Nocardia sp. NPDC052001 TaxID=3154853 RepID=UPI003416BAA4
MVAKESSAGGARRSQDIARARRRRRRPNIDGPKHTVEVVLSEEEFAKVREAADDAGMTVPWFLVQAAINPVASPKDNGPWLPWPKRVALRGELISATGAMDAIRLEQLAKACGNLNQLAHAANVTGMVAEDILETNEELRETSAELRERAERIEELAQQVVRR